MASSGAQANMVYEKTSSITPRIIIHGGAGNITPENLPEKPYNTYRSALLAILHDANHRLCLPDSKALDVATYAVSQLENNGLFNSGHGAVYTTTGQHELEASVMISRGYRKRGVGVMGVKRVKNPIMLAREMLVRGEEDDGGGAQGHQQLHGETCDRLAAEWGLDMVKPSYFWTRRRWDEHRKGVGLEHDDETYRKAKMKADESAHAYEMSEFPPAHTSGPCASALTADLDEAQWDGKEYLPQGTVGAVVMDSTGTICVATSTGGITNKLPGRIGDTPTLGAGFWAEEWTSSRAVSSPWQSWPPSDRSSERRFYAAGNIPGPNDWLTDCVQGVVNGVVTGFERLSEGFVRLNEVFESADPSYSMMSDRRAVAMCGTGNGDSFLKVNAVRTAAALARYAMFTTSSRVSLQDAVSHVAGSDGILQQSAEDRWHRTGEGEGGIIGIEFDGGRGTVVFDYNCGGMFHAWFDDHGRAKFQVFRDRVDEA